jgi:uncharacterized membrane protein YbhN (UPF0104 family)
MTGAARLSGQRWWRWVRPLGGVAVVGGLVVVGHGAVLDAVRGLDARSLPVGVVLAMLTTAGAAWRWRIVARRLGVELPMSTAVAACYRAQFLNVTLPGGVLGDVARGVGHGRGVTDVGRGLRAVVWERTAGQVVLAVSAVAVLAVARPFPPTGLAVPGWLPAAALVLLAGAGWAVHRRRRARPGRVARVLGGEARALLSPTASLRIVVASLLVLAGHVATFVVAARAAGVHLTVAELVPLALVVLLGAGLPLNVAGWGPREGAAAWVFAAVGLGAAQGLAVAVAYGAIVLVATLPGAVLLLAGRSSSSASRMPWRSPGRAITGAAVGVQLEGGGTRA